MMTLPIASHVGFGNALFFGIPVILALFALGLVAKSRKSGILTFLVGIIICFTWLVAFDELSDTYGDKGWAILYLVLSGLFLSTISEESAPAIAGWFQIGGSKKRSRPSGLLTFATIAIEFILASMIRFALGALA